MAMYLIEVPNLGRQLIQSTDATTARSIAGAAGAFFISEIPTDTWWVPVIPEWAAEAGVSELIEVKAESEGEAYELARTLLYTAGVPDAAIGQPVVKIPENLTETAGATAISKKGTTTTLFTSASQVINSFSERFSGPLPESVSAKAPELPGSALPTPPVLVDPNFGFADDDSETFTGDEGVTITPFDEIIGDRNNDGVIDDTDVQIATGQGVGTNPDGTGTIGNPPGGTGITGFADDGTGVNVQFTDSNGNPVTLDLKGIYQRILNGNITPDQFTQLLNDPEFQRAMANPAVVELLAPAVIASLGVIAGQQLDAAARLGVALINANPFGRNAAEDRALQEMLARGGINHGDAVRIAEISANAGISTPFAALANGNITFDQLLSLEQLRARGGLDTPQQVLNQARITASGGLDTAQQVLDLAQITASGGLTDAEVIADIQRQLARGAIDNPFAFVQAGLPIEQAVQLLEASQSAGNQANQVQREANFLNFIGNPSAVGTAVQAGSGITNPFTGEQLRAISDSPTGFIPGQLFGGIPATTPFGNFQGTPANSTEASIRGFNDEQLAFTEGQLAAQGITPSEAARQRAAVTPGTRQPVGANVIGF